MAPNKLILSLREGWILPDEAVRINKKLVIRADCFSRKKRYFPPRTKVDDRNDIKSVSYRKKEAKRPGFTRKEKGVGEVHYYSNEILLSNTQM